MVQAQGLEAFATLRDSRGLTVGAASLIQRAGRVLVQARFSSLPAGVHGFHVHAVGQCAGDFTSAGGHLDLQGAAHPSHAGDMPLLLVNGDGTAELRFETDRYTIDQLFDRDNSALIVHVAADNYGNIPTRYAQQPDPTAQATGDAGARTACGVVSDGAVRAANGERLLDQPANVQELFRAAWGDLAAEQWTIEQSIALDLKAVRQRFEGMTREQVSALGYQIDPFCVNSELEGQPGLGAMGLHAVHPDLYKKEFWLDRPQVLLLDGEGKVVGVEWETGDTGGPAPVMVGHMFENSGPHPHNEQDHWMQHVYFHADGSELIATWNPQLSCPAGSLPPPPPGR